MLTLLGLTTCVCVFPLKYFGYYFFTQDVELWILYGLTTLFTLSHVHYGSSVVVEMCNYFKIRCFQVRDSSKMD